MVDKLYLFLLYFPTQLGSNLKMVGWPGMVGRIWEVGGSQVKGYRGQHREILSQKIKNKKSMAGGVARMLAQYARGLRFNTRY
jgi:hypothetical protein